MRIHDQDDTCTVCSKPFKWSKRNWVRGEFIEVEFITAHAGCRSKMRVLNERKKKAEEKEKQIQDELLEIEWEMYQLCNPSKRLGWENIIFNGTYFIDKSI